MSMSAMPSTAGPTSVRLSRREALNAVGAGIGALALTAGKANGRADAATRSPSRVPAVINGVSALTISRAATVTVVAVADLGRFASHAVRNPVGCAECDSRVMGWRGIGLRGLVDSVGARRSEQVRLTSLAATGEKRTTLLGAARVQADTTLLALPADDQRLDVSHAHPVQLLVPGRSGDFRHTSLISIDVLV